MSSNNIKQIKYFVVDVDGTLTDSGIYYDENGNETKKFSTRDAAGFFALKKYGIKTIVITGRECASTEKRLTEMKVDYIFQNIKDKYNFLQKFICENGIKQDEICYVGDDLNDLSAMSLCGMVACPSDSCKEVKARADLIADKKGGEGAFRDIVEQLFTNAGEWEHLIAKIYNAGV